MPYRHTPVTEIDHVNKSCLFTILPLVLSLILFMPSHSSGMEFLDFSSLISLVILPVLYSVSISEVSLWFVLHSGTLIYEPP